MALAIIIREHIAELNPFFEFSWVLSISPQALEEKVKETVEMKSGLCLIIDQPNKKGGFGQKNPTPPKPKSLQNKI